MRVTAFFSLLSRLFYVFLPNTNHGFPIDKLEIIIYTVDNYFPLERRNTMQFRKHLPLMLSILLMVATLMTTLAVMTLSTFGEDNIVSDSPVTIKAYDTSPEVVNAHTPLQISPGSVVGIRLSLGAPFNKLTMCMPTWSDTDSDATLALYKWNTDFDTTMSAEPVAYKIFENFRDNSHNALTLDEELPAGEYFFCIKDVGGSRVGVWTLKSHVSKGFIYNDGVETTGDWEVSVSFTKTPAEPFFEMTSVADTIDGKHTPPDEYVIPEDSLLNTHKVMPDTWVFTDGLGRESLTYEDVGGIKEDKTAAMFYWTWHADLGVHNPLNVTEFIKQYPEAIRDYDHEAWPAPDTAAYFWNEPIFGYYKTNDTWVLRKHAELLANAGVDVIFTDNTNGNFTWKLSYNPLYETWDDAQKNGAVDVPKVSFMLPFGPNEGSKEQIESLYLDIYRRDRYQNLWFYWDGKPMLMAHNSNISSGNNLGKEILNFFTWRAGQPDYLAQQHTSKQWGWLSVYPQALYGERGESDLKRGRVEQTTVGVAVNHNYETHQIAPMNGFNVIGRSYSSTFQNRYEEEGDKASLWGYNFTEQMNYALEKNPKVLFITGWNEWTAGRHEEWGDLAETEEDEGIENAFPDQFNDEYSRDLEPTKGALKDHYYYLLVNALRQYKGVNPIPTPSGAVTIDLNGNEAQWENVAPYYAAYIGNTDDRDAKGYGDLVYTETSGRNDIIGAQIARDDEYVYFHVECAENITPYTDSLWMTLYIDSDGENQGWETFEYVVNKSAASADTVVLEKFTGNGYESTKVADCAYKVDGRYMTVKIAKSDLSLTGHDYTINFSWTDNVHDEGDYTVFSGDIMDFYISGDVAPGARFKYSYISTADNAANTQTPDDTTQDTQSETSENVETDTDAETSANTTADSEAVADSDTDTSAVTNGGCASVVSASLGLMLVAIMGAAVVISKKKES